MFELMLCSMLTILPDYLYRRYVQGKRFGHEITLFSVWFELRFGIVACLMLTVSLITMIFYFHPSTPTATMYFRTVPIIPETVGRVAEVHVDYSAQVKQGDVLFRLDNSKQQASLETAKRKIAEVDASMLAAEADVLKAEGQLQEAKSALQQAQDELDVKSELQRRNPGIVPQRDIEKLQVAVAGRQGLSTPRRLRNNPRDAGHRAPPGREGKRGSGAGRSAGRSRQDLYPGRREWPRRAVPAAPRRHRQSDDTARGHPDPRRRRAARAYRRVWPDRGQVMKVGMVAEATCISKPWMIIPMVVTDVQDYIAAGQFRGGEQLLEAQNTVRPGTILVFMEPLFKGGLDGVTPGSSCIANAYTSNHELISSGKLGSFKSFALHVVDATGLVHALLLRIQALLLPIKTLVLSGH